jgi:hypothetical protein
VRLYRPHVPLEVRCRVVLRQLGEMWPDERIKLARERRCFGPLLENELETLASTLYCEVSDLRLDHDPPLGARQRKGEGKSTVYFPAANNPEFLIYREKRAHEIKTNVRGDGAQYPDRVLIKRERRRREGVRAKPKRKLKSRPFPKGKRKIPSRSFRGTRS